MTRRDVRRKEIVAAARVLVVEGGLEALTIGNLEERLPFTRGVITYHFRDKAEIVDAVLDSAIAEIDALTFADAAAQSGLKPTVAAVLGGMTRGFLAHREASQILITFWSRLNADARTAEVNRALYARYRHLASGLVRSSGSSADADAVGALMVGAVIGIVTQHLFEPGFVPLERLVGCAVDMVVGVVEGKADQTGSAVANQTGSADR